MTSFQHTDSPHEASEGPESGRTQPQARTAEKVVALLQRDGSPKRLAFSEDYLSIQGRDDGL